MLQAGERQDADEQQAMTNAEALPPSQADVALHAQAGMDVTLTPGTLTLRFGEGVTVPSAPECRFAADLAPVLCEPSVARPDDLLYTVYRGLAPGDTKAEIERRGLLYVALVMRPGTVGEEWARTRGHINSHAPGTSIAFPEVHELWYGNALLYLQREAATEVSDTVVISLKAGDKAVVAPGWASLLCNVGDTPCVLGSWRAEECVPQHDALYALGGMAHFVLKGDAPGDYQLDTNSRYKSVAVPRTLPVEELTDQVADFGLKHGEPMITTFRRNPNFLRYMMRPQDHEQVWSRIYGTTATSKAGDGWL